jgi:hypothetical protein
MNETLNKLFWVGFCLIVVGSTIALTLCIGLLFVSREISQVVLRGAFVVCTLGFAIIGPSAILSKTNPLWEPFWSIQNE